MLIFLKKSTKMFIPPFQNIIKKYPIRSFNRYFKFFETNYYGFSSLHVVFPDFLDDISYNPNRNKKFIKFVLNNNETLVLYSINNGILECTSVDLKKCNKIHYKPYINKLTEIFHSDTIYDLNNENTRNKLIKIKSHIDINIDHENFYNLLEYSNNDKKRYAPIYSNNQILADTVVSGRLHCYNISDKHKFNTLYLPNYGNLYIIKIGNQLYETSISFSYS